MPTCYSVPVGGEAYRTPRKLVCVAFVTLSCTTTPWYWAYPKFTSGEDAVGVALTFRVARVATGSHKYEKGLMMTNISGWGVVYVLTISIVLFIWLWRIHGVITGTEPECVSRIIDSKAMLPRTKKRNTISISHTDYHSVSTWGWRGRWNLTYINTPYVNFVTISQHTATVRGRSTLLRSFKSSTEAWTLSTQKLRGKSGIY